MPKKGFEGGATRQMQLAKTDGAKKYHRQLTKRSGVRVDLQGVRSLHLENVRLFVALPLVGTGNVSSAPYRGGWG